MGDDTGHPDPDPHGQHREGGNCQKEAPPSADVRSTPLYAVGKNAGSVIITTATSTPLHVAAPKPYATHRATALVQRREYR